MPNVCYRIKTNASGKRVRQTISGGRIIATKSLPRKQTKTRKRLTRTRRRIRRS